MRPVVVALAVLLVPTALAAPVSADPAATVSSTDPAWAAPTGAASVAASPDYRPVDPARLADTRPGRLTVDGSFAGTGAVTPGSPLVLSVMGRGGLPESGVVAVALNVTVTGSSNSGHLTVYPTGQSRPLASNVNFDRSQTVANSVIAALGTANRVTIHSSTTAHLIVDVAGYFTDSGVTTITPARLADTRPGRATIDQKVAGTGVVRPATPLHLSVAGRGGVPLTGVTAVALNVVSVGSAAGGHLTVYPTGGTRPVASNLNFAAGRTVANSVVAPLGNGGRVTIYSTVPTHIVVDIVGYFGAGSSFVGISPQRFADTRSGRTTLGGPSYLPTRASNGVGPIGRQVGNGVRLDVLVSDRGSVPTTDVGAVVLNVTVTQPTSSGHLTIFPMGSQQPTASSLNFAPNQTVANLVVAKLGRGGGVSISSSALSSHVIVDVLGYLPGVSTAGSNTTWTGLLRDWLDMPMTYDRCKPIRYQINPTGAPSGWIDDVVTAVGVISEATGLDFQRLGDTTEVPVPNRSTRDGANNIRPLLVAFTTESVIPALGGSVVGIGGSRSSAEWDSVTFTPEQFLSGSAYFDREEVMDSGFGGDSFGQVALHELGHAIGLGHVANDNEIMNSFMIERSGYFGPGDLEGLSVLYRTQSCPGSPATHLATAHKAVAAAAPAAGGATPADGRPTRTEPGSRVVERSAYAS